MLSIPPHIAQAQHYVPTPNRRAVCKCLGVSVVIGTATIARATPTTPTYALPFWQQPRVIRLQTAQSPGTTMELEYWRDGQLQAAAYLALSRLCQDARAAAAVQMDPRVFDLMFATAQWYQHATGRKGVHVISSAYRTPATNALVGGATHSGHLTGQALDGHLMGLDLPTYARMLQAFGAGGVGLYTRHVHWDVGRSPRFWRGGEQE